MATSDQASCLQDVVDKYPELTEHFYNETGGPHFKSRTTLLAAFIPQEVTNWREEQRAWRETAVLMNQSHHMPVLLLKGRHARRTLDGLCISDLSKFGPGQAKQFIGCTPRGHMIGDCIAYCHSEDSFELISGMPILNWVHYNVEKSGDDLAVERDTTTPFNKTGKRLKYRFQLEGPNASKIFSEVVEGDAPEIPFFRTAQVTIKGHRVLVLRHGMAGHMGAELSGPYEELESVRSAIVEVGEKHGMRQGGLKSYFSTSYESGWIPYPLPGIYTGDDMRAYREWLPADCWEADAQLGGSYRSSNIEDYYVTPWDMGYGHLLKFTHDFVGRKALEAQADEPHRTKVTLVWNTEDTLKVFASQFEGPRYKSLDFPVAHYSQQHMDEVRTADGRFAGVSTCCGYSANEREALSLAMIHQEHAKVGTELVITWGEPNGGSRKPHVERHEQTTIRAVVAPAPYTQVARASKKTS